MSALDHFDGYGQFGVFCFSVTEMRWVQLVRLI